MNTHPPTALIAEDETLLANTLCSDLHTLWPQLQLLDTAPNGEVALSMARALAPDVLFLDIRMPALSGLEVAADLADAWPPAAHPNKPFPQLVFVTAYDQYAVNAFEAQAIDYVLKPWRLNRLQRTVHRLQDVLDQQAHNDTQTSLDAALNLLRPLLSATPTAGRALNHIVASQGHTLHYVPTQDVLAFQAADKYVRMLTADREYLIRTPLKDLMAQLPADMFWQIHRATLINAQALDKVVRDDNARQHVHIKGLRETFPVSRVFAGHFKAM